MRTTGKKGMMPGAYAPSIEALAKGAVDVRPLLAEAHRPSDFHSGMEQALSGDVLTTLIVPE